MANVYEGHHDQERTARRSNDVRTSDRARLEPDVRRHAKVGSELTGHRLSTSSLSSCRPHRALIGPWVAARMSPIRPQDVAASGRLSMACAGVHLRADGIGSSSSQIARGGGDQASPVDSRRRCSGGVGSPG